MSSVRARMAAKGVDILRRKVSCGWGEDEDVVYLVIGEFVLVGSVDVERRVHDRDNYVMEPAMRPPLVPLSSSASFPAGQGRPGPLDMKNRGRYQT